MVKRNTSKLAKRRYRVLGILKTLLLIVATGLSTPIKADDNELDIDIKGTVYDINQNEVLPAATVYIEELGIGVITDNEGVYRITGIPEGTYTLKVQFLGYQPTEKRYAQTAEPNQTTSALNLNHFLSMR